MGPAVANDLAVPVSESTAEDLEIQRHLLDLALQPLDRFDGFQLLDQVSGAALRYQLNFVNFALAMAQYTRTPAFTGYLAEAQANTIAKMCDRRVWSYWAYESLLGYGRWNPDPVARANVMYSGYLGVMLGLYETLNDDRRFSRPGSLRLRWSPRRCYEYDYISLAEAVQRNMLVRPRSPQYPCEPHLVYPICNTFALNALVMHDRIHATELTGDLVERVRTSYGRDGWVRPDGRFVLARLSRPTWTVLPPVRAHDAAMAYWLHAIMPEVAERAWEAVRPQGGRAADDEGAERRRSSTRGGRAPGRGVARMSLLATAREVGDSCAADRLERRIEEHHDVVRAGGARQLGGVYAVTNATYALARFTRHQGMSDLIHGRVPDSWRTGPVLAGAAYPDVLVARAVTDGEELHLVLRPGAGPTRTRLAIERLVPGRQYRVTGGREEWLVAGPSGQAHVELDLTGRTEVHLTPST